tara:strand:+ start:469 stop:942 length:474 start_codon:yes stop_codon:yes gene_type:complete
MRRSIKINKYCTDDKNNPERMGCELSKESWRPGVRKNKNTVCTGIMDFDRGIHKLSCSRNTRNLKCNFQTELDLSPDGKRKLKSSGYKKKRLPYLNCYYVESKSKRKSKNKSKSRHSRTASTQNRSERQSRTLSISKNRKGTKRKKNKTKKISKKSR